MTNPAGEFSLRIERLEGYEFKVSFENTPLAELLVDEPPPLGAQRGPNPARLLAAAIGSCLSASLVFCLSRARHHVGGVAANVRVELVRNDRRRLRIGRIDVELAPELQDEAAVESCLEAFEDFCVVTQSVREGIEVGVKVTPTIPR